MALNINTGDKFQVSYVYSGTDKYNNPYCKLALKAQAGDRYDNKDLDNTKIWMTNPTLVIKAGDFIEIGDISRLKFERKPRYLEKEGDKYAKICYDVKSYDFSKNTFVDGDGTVRDIKSWADIINVTAMVKKI